jgi:hypothetical protein
MYDDSGTAKVVNADATVGDRTSGSYKPCNCWISASASLGVAVLVYLPGQYVAASSLSNGATYWLDTTPAAITTTAPSASGNGTQVVGTAEETGAKLFFAPEPMMAI